jgi:ATP-dependent exoDNAse (exonuclease V) beta subunit
MQNSEDINRETGQTDMILERDSNIHFPNFSVLKASAGSGKTRTLTERYVEFLLSEKIPHNGLRNILAITFSNNAAKEMKERILLWLKSTYFDDPDTVNELSLLVSLDKQKMIDKAGSLIDDILHNYSDFRGENYRQLHGQLSLKPLPLILDIT